MRDLFSIEALSSMSVVRSCLSIEALISMSVLCILRAIAVCACLEASVEH